MKNLNILKSDIQSLYQRIIVKIDLLNPSRSNRAPIPGEIANPHLAEIQKLQNRLTKKVHAYQKEYHRYLKSLVDLLNQKADIYSNGIRLYTCDANWSLDDHGKLLHGSTPHDPATLVNGHNQTIARVHPLDPQPYEALNAHIQSSILST